VPRFPESSVTVNAPVTVPVVAGVNVTDTVQLLPAASIAGQLFVCANPSLTDTLFTPLSGLPPKFATVIVCGGLLVPTFCEIFKPGGVKLIAEGRGLGNDRGTAP
jgi:hypothetical protein